MSQQLSFADVPEPESSSQPGSSIHHEPHHPAKAPESKDEAPKLRSGRPRIRLRPTELLHDDKYAVDIVEAGERLGGLSKSTVYRLMEAGHLPYFNLGDRRLIRTVDIRDLIDQNVIWMKLDQRRRGIHSAELPAAETGGGNG